MKVFVSFSHKQREWVRDCAIPVLRASGAEVLFDEERFKAGFDVVRQMDASQDEAERHILIITNDYLASKYCCHEMNRAVALDPDFSQGKVIPVRLDNEPLPPSITTPDPLYVDLRDQTASKPWHLLIERSGGDLHTDAPAWLLALDQAKKHLERAESVNLVVNKSEIAWRKWLDEFCLTRFELPIVDLNNPATVSRDGLIKEILKATNHDTGQIPPPPSDLVVLGRAFESTGRSYVGLINFHRVTERDYYELNLFASLRYLVMDTRKLVLFVQTRMPVSLLLPQTHLLSAIDFKTVELG